jgi:hypothetical protein
MNPHRVMSLERWREMSMDIWEEEIREYNKSYKLVLHSEYYYDCLTVFVEIFRWTNITLSINEPPHHSEYQYYMIISYLPNDFNELCKYFMDSLKYSLWDESWLEYEAIEVYLILGEPDTRLIYLKPHFMSHALK